MTYKKYRRGEDAPERTLFEVTQLQKLEQEFINSPVIDHYPFPKVISYDDISMTISHCGISVRENLRNVNTEKYIQPVNLYNTVECIINNLINSGIKHSDIKPVNVCIAPNGCVCLIDFGSSKNGTKKKVLNRYKKPNLDDYKLQLHHNMQAKSTRYRFMLGPATMASLSAIPYNESQDSRDDFTLFKWNPWSILYMF